MGANFSNERTLNRLSRLGEDKPYTCPPDRVPYYAYACIGYRSPSIGGEPYE